MSGDGILGVFKGKIFRGGVTKFNPEAADGTTTVETGLIKSADEWAKLVMRDRGITKTWNAIKRDLIAINQGAGKPTWDAVNKHYTAVLTNIKLCHELFLKNFETEYSAGNSEEDALEKAYSNIGPLVIAACKRAEYEHPIAQIMKLAKNASLNIT
jgi:hypothetical protein